MLLSSETFAGSGAAGAGAGVGSVAGAAFLLPPQATKAAHETRERAKWVNFIVKNLVFHVIQDTFTKIGFLSEKSQPGKPNMPVFEQIRQKRSFLTKKPDFKIA
jgi:hypothetical protein